MNKNASGASADNRPECSLDLLMLLQFAFEDQSLLPGRARLTRIIVGFEEGKQNLDDLFKKSSGDQLEFSVAPILQEMWHVLPLLKDVLEFVTAYLVLRKTLKKSAQPQDIGSKLLAHFNEKTKVGRFLRSRPGGCLIRNLKEHIKK